MQMRVLPYTTDVPLYLASHEGQVCHQDRVQWTTGWKVIGPSSAPCSTMHLHKAPPLYRHETPTLHSPTTPRVHSRVAPRVTNGYIIYTEATLVFGRLQLEEAHVQHGAPKWQL